MLLTCALMQTNHSATARRKFNELFIQFDNVTTACQFHNAKLDSLTCINDALSLEASVNP